MLRLVGNCCHHPLHSQIIFFLLAVLGRLDGKSNEVLTVLSD